MSKNQNDYSQREPRAASMVVCHCHAQPVLFLPWDKMPKAAQQEFAINGPIPCEGGGLPGPWCADCRFGVVTSPEHDQ